MFSTTGNPYGKDQTVRNADKQRQTEPEEDLKHTLYLLPEKELKIRLGVWGVRVGHDSVARGL